MKKLLMLFSLAIGIVFTPTACKESQETPAPPRDTEYQQGDSHYWDSSNVRAFISSSPSASRYLGRGFDLLNYERTDPEGLTIYSALDLKRIQNNTPWNPFNQAGMENALAPEATELEGSDRPKQETIKESGKQAYTDSVSFSLGIGYKGSKIEYTHKTATDDVENSYVYRSRLAFKFKKVNWDIDNVSDYGFFLNRRFVLDLKRLKASALVEKYGTHIVTSYSVGALQELRVTANTSTFSKEETEKIHGSILDGILSITNNAFHKVITNRNRLSITYTQAGSAYIPPRPFLAPNLFFKEEKDTPPLDVKSFVEQIKKESNDFVELEGSLVSIPDLIANIPLKVKYACGILAKSGINGAKPTVYVLSDPSTYEVIRKDGEHLTIRLDSYYDSHVRIYVGDSAFDKINDPEDKSGRTIWDAQLNEEGLWILKSLHRSRYLCRDLKIRSLEEDKDGLRFWGLNPILQTKSGSRTSLAGLLIQPKQK